MRQLVCGIALTLTGVVAFAAPVPKPSGKVDPGKPWEFPDLDSKGWEKKESGLKVWDVKQGDGNAVKAGDTVKVKFAGWLSDGRQLEGGADTPELSIPLSAVIKGWQEGLVGMKPGGIRRLYIPADLGYGKTGHGSKIPDDAVMVFVIEYVGPGK